jgi:hypothetical protein
MSAHNASNLHNPKKQSRQKDSMTNISSLLFIFSRTIISIDEQHTPPTTLFPDIDVGNAAAYDDAKHTTTRGEGGQKREGIAAMCLFRLFLKIFRFYANVLIILCFCFGLFV